MYDTEIWTEVFDFEAYHVSNTGKVRKARPYPKDIGTQILPDGSIGVKLYGHGRSYQFLMRRLVAEAFCDRRSAREDSVIHIDGDKLNCNASNLAWRPRWFVWKYTNQFRTLNDVKWYRPVFNVTTGQPHESVVAAGLHDATLWEEIVKSAMTGAHAYPGISYEFLSIKEFYGPEADWG